MAIGKNALQLYLEKQKAMQDKLTMMEKAVQAADLSWSSSSNFWGQPGTKPDGGVQPMSVPLTYQPTLTGGHEATNDYSGTPDTSATVYQMPGATASTITIGTTTPSPAVGAAPVTVVAAKGSYTDLVTAFRLLCDTGGVSYPDQMEMGQLLIDMLRQELQAQQGVAAVAAALDDMGGAIDEAAGIDQL